MIAPIDRRLTDEIAQASGGHGPPRQSSPGILNAWNSLVVRVAAVVIAAGVIFLTDGVVAQVNVASPLGWDPLLLELFREAPSFRASARLHVLDRKGEILVSVSGVSFTVHDRSVRIDVDMSETAGARMPEGMAASVKRMGLNRVSAIIVPREKAMRVVYPGLQAYLQLPLSREDLAGIENGVRKEAVDLEIDPVDGYHCRKRRITMTDGRGGIRHATVWNASNLDGFPLRMEIPRENETMVLHFQDVKLGGQQVEQFQPPPDYQRYDDVQKLLSVVIQGGTGGVRSQGPRDR